MGKQPQILALACSPRTGGNSEILLDRLIEGATEGGANVEKLHVPRLTIAGCVECNGCFGHGYCVVEDDFQHVAKKITDADRVVIATPVFFMAPSAQAKAMIDRCQSFWARKYVLKAPLKEESSGLERRGVWISVGGTRGVKLFDGIKLTMEYFFDAIYISSYVDVKAWHADAKGEILKQQDVLREAHEKGVELARP